MITGTTPAGRPRGICCAEAREPLGLRAHILRSEADADHIAWCEQTAWQFESSALRIDRDQARRHRRGDVVQGSQLGRQRGAEVDAVVQDAPAARAAMIGGEGPAEPQGHRDRRAVKGIAQSQDSALPGERESLGRRQSEGERRGVLDPDRRREQVVDPYLLGFGVDRGEIEDEAPELRIDRDVSRRERHGAAARAGRIAEIGQVPGPDREPRTERRIGDAQSPDPDREARRRGAELQLTPGQFRTGERGAIEAVHQLEHYARLAVGQRERPVVEAEAPAVAPGWQRIRPLIGDDPAGAEKEAVIVEVLLPDAIRHMARRSQVGRVGRGVVGAPQAAHARGPADVESLARDRAWP